MTKIKFENVNKKFDSVVAADNVNLEINDKEFFIILGPSGGGKSTLLNLIAGLEQVDSGTIYFDDKPINDVPPEKRNVAMVFQSYAIYPHMNVFDNVAMGLRAKKLAKQEVKKQVENATEMLGIREYLNRKPYQLSGGERQRVALARALVRRPDAFLLDEPLANIDAKLRQSVRVELKSLQRQFGITTVYVTHDQTEAMSMGDRVALIRQGKIIQTSTPSEMYSRPLNTFVAEFLGSPSITLFETDLRDKDGRYIFEAPAFVLELPLETAKMRNITATIRNKARDNKVMIGFRPEDLAIHKESLNNAIEGKIYLIENLGKESIITLKIGERLIQAVSAHPPAGVHVDDTVWLTVDFDKMYIFDKETQQNLLI